MRILMVGAGATGGFYGGMLARAGRDITFLLREGRARQVRANGLQILPYQAEPVTVHPPVRTAAELRAQPEPFDLILLSTKAYQLEEAMADITPAVGPQTMLMPILNGMRHFALLDKRFGAEKILGGSVRIVSDLGPDGAIHQLTALDQFNYGERSGERTVRIVAVDEALTVPGYQATLQPDIMTTLWAKWVILASMGTVCILARGSAGQVALAPFGPAFAEAVVRECAAIAEANGFPSTQTQILAHSQRMAEPGSTLTSSMYRDMVKGAPVEADHILGDLLDRARGVAAPLLTAAYVQLKVYEGQRL